MLTANQKSTTDTHTHTKEKAILDGQGVPWKSSS